ncbi:MAG: hypothetical protein J6I40_00840, partial [Mailhella sp.]|nr:hypothetical protein [Mailhella sp.]
AAHDSASIIALVGELLSQGIDMGFFLRELTGLWRDLFLACQPGKSLWDGQEKKAMAASAARFSPSFIHAAWQMTLDSQRRILTSLEPSIGLELLLLNLAMLPRLLPLRELSTVPAPENMAGLVSSRKIPAEEKDLSASVFELVPANAKSGDEAFMVKKKSGDMSESEAALEVKKPLARPFAREVPREHAENDRACVYAGSGVVSQGWKHADIDQELRWENFLLTMGDDKDLPMPLLRQITGEIRGDWLVLQPFSQVVAQKMQIVERRGTLEKRVETWAGRHLEVVFRSPQKIVRTEAEIKEEINRHALVKKFQDSFDAVLVHVKS